MEVYTIGFTKKTAEQFFTLLKNVGVKRLLDVRLHNVSQLAGFAKRDDLAFFLREMCEAEYLHEPRLAPTQDMLDAYKKHKAGWEAYRSRFLELMEARRIDERLDRSLFAGPTVLLCSEATAQYCHRRLVLEYLLIKWEPFEIVHL